MDYMDYNEIARLQIDELNHQYTVLTGDTLPESICMNKHEAVKAIVNVLLMDGEEIDNLPSRFAKDDGVKENVQEAPKKEDFQMATKLLRKAAKKKDDPFGVMDLKFSKEMVRLGDLDLYNMDGQPDGRFNQAYSDEIGQLAAQGKDFFSDSQPMIIWVLDGKRIVLDGMQRARGIVAHVEDGHLLEVPAEVYEGTVKQCKAKMMTINQHGRPNDLGAKRSFAYDIWLAQHDENDEWYGISQNQIAKHIGTSPMNISNWFRGWAQEASAKAKSEGGEYEGRAQTVTTANGLVMDVSKHTGPRKEQDPKDPKVADPVVEFEDIGNMPTGKIVGPPRDDEDEGEIGGKNAGRKSEFAGSDGNVYSHGGTDTMLITAPDGTSIPVSLVALTSALNSLGISH